MREAERDYGRLIDILEAADNILTFTKGYTMEQLNSDKLRYYAVVKNVEIIGEAAYMLSLIQPDLLFNTALYDVPVLKAQIQIIVDSSA